MITVKTKVDLSGTTRRRKRVVCDDAEMPGRLPRITRLMALAIRFDELLRTGKVRDLAHLADIGNVSQPRISQILSLVLLAPDIQESLLFLPRIHRGKPKISEKRLRPITALVNWDEQRKRWKQAGFGDLSDQV
ncbi:hypothetical protein [Novipirellula artificiosorum]|uniref:Uncharacterized protein n=1 Tax=Novipirellula artificiosorum TaxID=2528016 RepID=A0A5C6DTF4_9BACT|nr:hypothetical protein [Novipirellula artificiosorum]TWU39474.1 hypothetical protein Poly41_22980 [Novipirellula artificiosorum]